MHCADIKIEEASASRQIETIEGLAHEIWDEHFTPIIGKAQVDYMLKKFQSKKAIKEQIRQGFWYFLLSIEEKNTNKYIGYIGIIQKEKQLFLSKFYIKLHERNKGYGKTALAFLEKMALEKGADNISLTVNKNNSETIKAYEKLGFKNIGSVVQNIGNNFVMDDYKMEKIIN